MTRKLIIHDGRSERELVLIGTITVGRDPGCHISDLDPLLSRRHAHFVTSSIGCTVTDLNSRNGMLVNGLKVREHRLVEGDLVQLGHLQLRYSEDRTVSTAERSARQHATTAHEAVTVAITAPAMLEDTRPHPPHIDGDDDDMTRLPGVRRQDDLDATRLPTTASADEDPTMAPRGVMAAAAEVDATFVTANTSLNDTAIRTDEREARLTTGQDLRITAASPACRGHFGVPPDVLIGRPLGDVLAEHLKAAGANGATELTFLVEPAAGDRSLIVTLKAAQAVETVS